MRLRFLPALLIGFLAFPSLAQADLIGFSFFARVSRINLGHVTELPEYGVAIGTLMTGVVTFDQDFLNPVGPWCEECYGNEGSGGTLTLTVGSIVVTSPLFFTAISRTSDSVHWQSEYEYIESNVTASYIDSANVILSSSWSSQVPVGAALLQSFDPTLWDDGSVGIWADCCGGPHFVINGTITHTEALPVPEPSSLLLGLLGVASAGAARFRRFLLTPRAV
jgi:hypothetical protein